MSTKLVKTPAVAPAQLRGLLRSLARTVLASSCVVSCTGEGGLPNDAPATRDDDNAARGRERDGAIGPGTPTDAKPRPITSWDASAPIVDAARMPDAASGPHDAAQVDAAREAQWEPVCDLARARDLSDLTTSRQIAFLGIYAERFGGQSGPTPFVIEHPTRGTTCAPTQTAEVCAAELAKAKQLSAGCPPMCVQYALTRSDERFERLDRSAFVALLGEVDTRTEALLLAMFDGHSLGCDDFSARQGIGVQIRASAAGGYELDTTYERCSEGIFHDRLTVSRDGRITVVEHVQLRAATCVVGRRPAGFSEPESSRSASGLGEFLANLAQLEAASVHAFIQIAGELRALGAPSALIELALDAVSDEVRHAEAMAGLARRFGAEPVEPRIPRAAQRSAYELALDNAVEGCVRETFGALVATYQAETALDAEVRAVMREIAEDETRHARFSWELAAWLSTRLDSTQSEHVRSVRDHAIAQLETELDCGLSRSDGSAIGFPAREQSHRLWSGLADALWSAS